MPAPAAVQKQVAAADRIHNEVYGKPDEQIVDDPKPNDVIAELPGAEATIVKADEQPIKPEPNELEKAQHKYDVLQGKYNKEVPQLHNQMKELNVELNQMRNLLASLETAKTPVELKPGEKLLKPEEIEEYGEDMISVVRRAAKEELMPIIQQLQDENTKLNTMLGNMSESVAGNARTGVYRYLDAEVPNWKELNADQVFLTWLDEIDVMSGVPRRALLQQAHEENNAARVASFFISYLKENATVEPVKVTETVTETKVDVMSMAAPGKPQSGTTTVVAQEDKPVYTQAGITEFYRDIQQGKFKGREDVRLAIEQDIIAAGSENRIRT